MCAFVGCRGLLVLFIAATCCWNATGQESSSYLFSSWSSDSSDSVVSDLPCIRHGKIFLHGETSRLDDCTTCVCDNSTLSCQFKSCPLPLQCSHSERIKLKGVCCQICPNSDSVNEGAPPVSPDTSKEQDSVVSDLPCKYQGRIFRHGEVDRTNDCSTCVCHNSTMSCQFMSCPPLPCRERIKLKGVCCQVCPNT